MEIKNWFCRKYKEGNFFLLAILVLGALSNWSEPLNAMHFDRKGDELKEMLKDASPEEVEDIRQSVRSSKVSDYKKHYPLHAAIAWGNKEQIELELLCTEEEYLDEEDAEGKTPLYIAAFYRRREVIQILLDRGAQVRKVLQHPNGNFLRKANYKEERKLLVQAFDGEADASIVNTKLDTREMPKRKFQVTREKIEKIISGIGNDHKKGIIILTGIIKKLISTNDFHGLRRLIQLRIDLVDKCLRDQNIILDAIHFAQEGDYKIVNFLLSIRNLTFISEDTLVRAYILAKKKKDTELMAICEKYSKLFFPRSTLLRRCVIYKCGEEKKRIVPDCGMVVTKKRFNMVKFCALGVMVLGFIGYQWLRTDISTFNKAVK